jgi:hypothetical protein
MDKRVSFLKIYANLPLSVRSDVVVVVKNEPLTWNSAHLEVEQNTPVGKEILEILTKLKILK